MAVIINIQKQGNNITNIQDWYTQAPPEGGQKKWKKGRSALELARFATCSQFNVFIEDLLKKYGLDCNQTFECEPEALTYFPSDTMGKNGPRHHDLLMIGKDCVVGIEAKVSEAFDKTLKDKYKGAGENMKKRLDGAKAYIYGDDVPKESDDLQYQLFSATIGTILEAKKLKARNLECKNAITLVIVFKGDVDYGGSKTKYEDFVDKNKEAFDKFLSSIQHENDRITVAQAEDINCYLVEKDIEVNIPQIQYIYK